MEIKDFIAQGNPKTWATPYSEETVFNVSQQKELDI